MKFLLVVAHPADEALGFGATINRMKKMGHVVGICILCGNAEARNIKDPNVNIRDEIDRSCNMNGISNKYIAEFPNIMLNKTAHIELVQFIENAILDFKPDVIITHHPSDTNNDHYHTSLACQEALRINLRNNKEDSIQELWYMEIQSSTDWSLNTAMCTFKPNLFIEISEYDLDNKILNLSCYSGTLHDVPHPRSKNAIFGLASFRGGQAGFRYAEAFECVYRKLYLHD